MTTANYAPPVDKLLTYGDCSQMKEVPNYVEELGFEPEHIPELLRMAEDEKLTWASSESLEVWAPLHAWRSLGQLRAEAAIEPLMLLLDELEIGDWVIEEMPEIMGNIGAAAIPSLVAYLGDRDRDELRRAIAGDAIAHIAKRHPEVRDECIRVLMNQVELFEENSKILNGMLVLYLAEIDAVEAVPLVERAWLADRIAPHVMGDWEDIQVEFGLRMPEKLPLRMRSPEELLEEFLGKAALKELEEEESRGFGQVTEKSNKKSSKKKKKKRK